MTSFPPPPSPPGGIADRLRQIRDRMAEAALRAGRSPEDIALVAVSKTHPADRIEAAIAAGQRCFGENRVQEAMAKFPALRARHPDLRIHLIGGLQTNKARDAVCLADTIESLDRPRLLDALAAAMDRPARRPDRTLSLLVQVNTGHEPQKSGVPRQDADAFIAACRDRLGSAVRGLMCIPPEGDDPAPHFAWLADRAARHGLAVVSMGMSGDFETAIAQGATQVRVGSALFGAR